jgi:hypothetical protein
MLAAEHERALKRLDSGNRQQLVALLEVLGSEE